MSNRIDDGLDFRTRYDLKYARKVTYKFNARTDADILEWLDHQPSKQGAVKAAIRFYMANQQNSVE